MPLEQFSVGYAKHGDNWKPDSLVVRPEDGPHRVLTVTWPACTGPVVTPRLVRACIQQALCQGWLADGGTLNLAGPDVADLE